MSTITNDEAYVSLPESWVTLPDRFYIDKKNKELQQNIDTEASTRSSEDTVIRGDISAETETRTNADTVLQQNIDTEESSRTAADTKLQQNITVVDNKFNNYTPTLNIPEIKVNEAGKATNDGNGNNIAATYATQENTYTKEAIDQKVASVYKYKGSVATVAELPTTEQVTGDVYDVQDTGINYAWNGTSWDALGQILDLTPYAKKTDVPDIKVNNAGHADSATDADNAANAADAAKLGGQLAERYALKADAAVAMVGNLQIFARDVQPEEGWLLCDGRRLDVGTYPRLAAAIGTKFDPQNATVKLPDLRNKVAYGASGEYALGKYVEEQLPNIQGCSQTRPSNYDNGRNNVKGCYTYVESGLYTPAGSLGAASNHIGNIFDAKKTVDKHSSTDTKIWTTINNPAYKDPVNGKPVPVKVDGVAVNWYIKY